MEPSFELSNGKEVRPSMRNERVFISIVADVETAIRRGIRCLTVGEGNSVRCLTNDEKEPFYIAAQLFAKAALELKQEMEVLKPGVSPDVRPPARKMLLAANDEAYLMQTASARHNLQQVFANYPKMGQTLLDSIDSVARRLHHIVPQGTRV